MKLLKFNGPSHFLEVPGFFTIARGESHEIDEHVAEAVVRANPDLDLEITEAKVTVKKRPAPKGDESQPEAHQGEGHAAANDLQEE